MLFRDFETITESTKKISTNRYERDEYGIVGTYHLNRDCEKKYQEDFRLEVRVSNNKKNPVPRVWISEESMSDGFCHVYAKGYICMGTKLEIMDAWGDERSAESFFENVVDVYLINLISFRDTGVTITGERSHGEEGIFDYYRRYFPNISNDQNLKKVLLYINKIAKKDKIVNVKKHRICPCGSKKEIKDCCKDGINEVVKVLSSDSDRCGAFKSDIEALKGAKSGRKRENRGART